MKIGLQIYSVRDALEQDYAGTVAQLRGFGYEGVELFGAHKSAGETKSICDAQQLVVPSQHFLLDHLEQDLNACIERVRGIGASTVVCAWSKPSNGRTWTSIVDSLEVIAQHCQTNGLAFAYHNHEHELLEREAGLRVIDLMAERAPTLKFEFDIAWLHAGEVKPSDYLTRYAERTVLVHIKDVARQGEGWQTVELGQGEVDLASALAASRQTATKWWLIEQDHSPNPLESAKRNAAWLLTKR